MLVTATDSLEFRALPGRRSADPFAGRRTPDASVRVVEVPGGGPRTPHRHPHSSETIYVLEGSGLHRQGAEELRVSAGDLVFVPRGVPHCTSADEGVTLRLLCFFPHPDLANNMIEED